MSHRKLGDKLNGRYRVVGELGQGAMGAVYLVEDEKLGGAQWALKELEISMLIESERPLAEALFRREADILSKLLHPGIPRVIDFYTAPDGCDGLVMERIQGRALDEILDHLPRPLLPTEAIPIALQVTQVLEYLHGQSPPIIFRDLKPSNLMIARSGRVYFIDFGIARAFQLGQAKDTQELGTPGFCAPEQYGHGQTTQRSDIYALGTTLFYLLSGQDPQRFSFKVPELSTVATVTPLLEKLVARCLQLQPQDRYPDVPTLRRDLEQAWLEVQAQPPGSTQPLGLASLPRHPKRPQTENQELKQYVKKYIRQTFHLW